MSANIATIGGRFMLSEMFETAIRDACGDAVACRKLDLPWPDEPMEHGYARPGMDGLKEYMGKPEASIDFVAAAPVFVTRLAPVSAAMLERMPALKLIAASRGGPVNIDMDAARARGVAVVNAPGRNAGAVAEFAIGAILAETRNSTRGHDALRRGDWSGDLYRADETGEELSELTVGVIGYGNIGTRVVRLVARDALLAQADIVTLHARVTPETTGFLDADAFATMKRGAIFVNTARGPMIDYDALLDALESGHLRGAMLETFAVEPAPPDWRLLQLPNVTLTPHIAGASLKTVKIAAEEIRRHLAGEPPLNPC